jgi:hypothetical protein
MEKGLAFDTHWPFQLGVIPRSVLRAGSRKYASLNKFGGMYEFPASGKARVSADRGVHAYL